MNEALTRAKQNIARARHLVGLHASLVAVTTDALDLSDILRASLVLGVSALDAFIHDLVRAGMVEQYKGTRPKTDAYRAFRLPLEILHRAVLSPTTADWLNDAVRDALSWQSFQRADKIASALAHICPTSLWEAVARRLRAPAETIRRELELIVDRRNKIAHEADMNPASPSERWPIDAQQVSEALDFLEAVCEAILAVV